MLEDLEEIGSELRPWVVRIIRKRGHGRHQMLAQGSGELDPSFDFLPQLFVRRVQEIRNSVRNRKGRRATTAQRPVANLAVVRAFDVELQAGVAAPRTDQAPDEIFLQ